LAVDRIAPPTLSLPLEGGGQGRGWVLNAVNWALSIFFRYTPDTLG
jgi:hypothetical protein